MEVNKTITKMANAESADEKSGLSLEERKLAEQLAGAIAHGNKSLLKRQLDEKPRSVGLLTWVLNQALTLNQAEMAVFATEELIVYKDWFYKERLPEECISTVTRVLEHGWLDKCLMEKQTLGRVLLPWATQQRAVDAMQILIEKGADVNYKLTIESVQETALSIAIRSIFTDGIRILLEADAKVTFSHGMGMKILQTLSNVIFHAQNHHVKPESVNVALDLYLKHGGATFVQNLNDWNFESIAPDLGACQTHVLLKLFHAGPGMKPVRSAGKILYYTELTCVKILLNYGVSPQRIPQDVRKAWEFWNHSLANCLNPSSMMFYDYYTENHIPTSSIEHLEDRIRMIVMAGHTFRFNATPGIPSKWRDIEQGFASRLHPLADITRRVIRRAIMPVHVDKVKTLSLPLSLKNFVLMNEDATFDYFSMESPN